MPKMYVSLFLPGQACLKVKGDDGRQVSVAFTRTNTLFGEVIAEPSIKVEPVKVFYPNSDTEIVYSNIHSDEATALLHALADVLGYNVTRQA